MDIPSSCFAVVTGNITLISVAINSNNVLISFRIDDSVRVAGVVVPSAQIQIRFLSATAGATYYCQRTSINSTFECLIIYPYGVSNSLTYILIYYSYQGRQGSTIAEVSGLSSVLSARNRKG